MKIENLTVESLIPYARNARTHSDTQVQQIADSITEFGFNNPVLVDEAGGIIAGHGRVMAAKLLGKTKVPCIRLSHLSERQKRAYILADNKIALNSGWDFDILADEVSELSELDFDLDLMGFDEQELASLLQHEPGIFPGEKDVEVSSYKRRAKADDKKGKAEAPEATKPGEIWQLGEHRLILGNTQRPGDADLVLRHWEEFTGVDAVRVDGVHFKDLRK